MSFDPNAVGGVVSREKSDVLRVFGPTVEPLTVAEPFDSTAPGLLRGAIPAGQTIPMHAHSDPETFYVLSGQLDGLAVSESGPMWIPFVSGQIFHVPSNARHALRNVGSEPARALIITTPRMVRFFECVGTVVDDLDPSQPPSPDVIERFARESAARGYWNASPQENAEVGIELPPVTSS